MWTLQMVIDLSIRKVIRLFLAFSLIQQRLLSLQGPQAQHRRSSRRILLVGPALLCLHSKLEDSLEVVIFSDREVKRFRCLLE